MLAPLLLFPLSSYRRLPGPAQFFCSAVLVVVSSRRLRPWQRLEQVEPDPHQQASAVVPHPSSCLLLQPAEAYPPALSSLDQRAAEQSHWSCRMSVASNQGQQDAPPYAAPPAA